MIGRVLCHMRGRSSRVEEVNRELLECWIAARSGHRHCADSHQMFSHEEDRDWRGAAARDIATLPPLFCMRNGKSAQSLLMVREASSTQETVRNSEREAVIIARWSAGKQASLIGVLVIRRRTKEIWMEPRMYLGNGMDGVMEQTHWWKEVW